MFRHILLPTDGSELSQKAAKAGIQLARSLGAMVTGFYAFDTGILTFYGDYFPRETLTPKQFEQAERKRAAEYLDAIKRAAQAAGVGCEVYTVASDHPHEAIVKAAQDRRCDLIFMATHGRRGVSGMLLGSETMKVLTHAKIPVLVYR